MHTVWAIPWRAIPTAKRQQRHSGEMSPQDEEFFLTVKWTSLTVC